MFSLPLVKQNPITDNPVLQKKATNQMQRMKLEKIGNMNWDSKGKDKENKRVKSQEVKCEECEEEAGKKQMKFIVYISCKKS